MRSALISTKPFIFDLFLVGVTVQSAESLSPAIPLGTSTKRAIKRAITDDRVFFKMLFRPCPLGCSRFLLSSVSGHSAHWSCVSWMIHAPVVGVWTWHRCDLAFPFWKDWHPLPPPVLVSLAQAEDHRLRSGRSEGHSKSFSAGLVPTDLLLLTQRASRPAPGWFCWFFPRDGQHIMLSQPKLIVLRARQPLPCMPWRSCRFTKPRHSKKCTRVVPTRGWCRSCARRRMSRHGPSGRRCPLWWSRSAISGSTWQRWRTSTEHAFSMPPSPRLGCSATLSRALPSSSRQCRSRPRWSSTSCHGGMLRQLRLPLGPGLRLLVAVEALLCPPELLRPVLKRQLGRRVEPLAGVRRPPRPIRALSRPGNRRSGPDAGNPEMLEFALSQETTRTASLLPPVEGRVENLMFPLFLFRRWPKGQQHPHIQRKSNFLFLRVFRSTGRQCAMHCLLTLARDPFCQWPRERGSGTQCHRTPMSSRHNS